MNWEELQIKDVVIGLYDGPHATPPPSNEGPIFLGIQNIKERGGLELSQIRHINEADWSKWTKRVTPQEDDIVFTYEATLNLYAIIPKGFRGCLGRRMALLRADKSKINHKYLYYYFFSPGWRQVIGENILSGATVDRIPLTRFPNFRILVPDRQTQDKVVAQLSSIDELIETNELRIKTLEEVSQLLYREWFVNFQFPNHKNVRLVDSGQPEFGMIPEGWEVKTLKEVCSINQHSFKAADLPSVVKYIDISAVGVGIINDLTVVDRESAPGRARRKVSSGDTLWSCVRPNRRSFAFISSPGNDWVASTGFAVLSPKAQSASFVYHLTTTPEFTAYLVSRAQGAAYPAVRPEDFSSAPVIVPSAQVIDAFEKATRPILDLKNELISTNKGLSMIRDLLLPKLLSGEIDFDGLELNSLSAAGTDKSEFDLRSSERIRT
jgi:type I restriction enzyme S subunit